MLTFRIPTQNDCQEILAYRTEILRCTESFDGSAGLGEFERFSAWLERLELLAPGRAEKYGYYPTLVRLAYEDDRLAGILNVRVTEDAFVRTYAGHIGYNVRPSCRSMALSCASSPARRKPARPSALPTCANSSTMAALRRSARSCPKPPIIISPAPRAQTLLRASRKAAT